MAHQNEAAMTDTISQAAEVAAWERHCRIRYAKAMQKASSQ
jgi:hypothetical protein